MTQRELLFASIVGSRVAEQIPRFSLVQNELMKHVLPAVPFLPIKTNTWESDKPLPESKQFFPFSFYDDEDKAWILPYEPMVNISGKNTIIRRNVAKSNNELIGSIKERWSQNDYEITITGVLIGSIMTGDVSQCYPLEDFQKLKEFMCKPARLKVTCPPLELLGINYIVIEDFNFPFTKGENVQAYEIKAYSDYDYKLLLEIDD